MLKGNTHLVFMFVFNAIAGVVMSQQNWEEKTTNANFFSGIPVATADVNGDALDDLLVLDQTKHLWLGLQYGHGEFFWRSLNYHHTFPAWSVNVGDIDRNGYNDILISGERTQLHVLYQYATGFTGSTFDDSYLFSQAAVIYDVNQDGWLDFTLCDDNSVNRIYINNAMGQLRLDTNIIKMGFEDINLDAGNYGCIWTDLENDGDPDLYISKCRPGVEDPNDPRRLNQLWIHDQGQWVSAASVYGLDVGDQSWVSLFEDFDNDGLKDVMVINHYTPCRLFRQKADHSFEDVTTQSGFNSAAIIIQALPADFDNDGDIDVLVTGNASELWLNNGAMQFTKLHTPLQDANFSSCAYGDFNLDGFIDVYALHADLLNTPNNQKDQLWINPANENHFIKFTLKGKKSNPNGIGARVVVYTGPSIQTRELHGGEAFGIQNSLNVHFGLKNYEFIDSVVFHWPSGVTDRHYLLMADKHYIVEEDNCFQELGNGIANKVVYYCDQIDTVVRVSQLLTQISWNNGSIQDSLHIKDEGVYYFTAYDENKCIYVSGQIACIKNPRQLFSLNHKYDKILCEGESLELSVHPPANIVWSDNRTDQTITVNQTSKYFARAMGLCDEFYTDTLNLFVAPQISAPQIETDTLLTRRPAILISDSEATQWFNHPNDANPVYTGKVFTTDSLDANRSFWAAHQSGFSYPFVHGGLHTPVYSSSAYHADFLNAQMIFNVYQDIVLDSVSLFTDFPGIRIIDLLNDMGERIASREVDLSAGKNQIFLDFKIPASEKLYTLTTNLDQNQKTFGENSPKLQRSNEGFFYPIFIQDKIRLLTSNNGDSYYYYFYDWVIHLPDKLCESERVEVKVLFQPVQTKEYGKSNFKFIQRNDEFMVVSGMDLHIDWGIYTTDGRCLFQNNSRSNTWIRFPELMPGVYLLYGRTNQGAFISKLMHHH